MKRGIFKSEHTIFRTSFKKYLKDKIVSRYDEWEKQGGANEIMKALIARRLNI